MNILKQIFGKRQMPPEQPVSASDQAVLVYLDGQGLPEEVYRDHDVATLEDQLRKVIDNDALGEFGRQGGPGAKQREVKF